MHYVLDFCISSKAGIFGDITLVLTGNKFYEYNMSLCILFLIPVYSNTATKPPFLYYQLHDLFINHHK